MRHKRRTPRPPRGATDECSATRDKRRTRPARPRPRPTNIRHARQPSVGPPPLTAQSTFGARCFAALPSAPFRRRDASDGPPRPGPTFHAAVVSHAGAAPRPRVKFFRPAQFRTDAYRRPPASSPATPPPPRGGWASVAYEMVWPSLTRRDVGWRRSASAPPPPASYELSHARRKSVWPFPLTRPLNLARRAASAPHPAPAADVPTQRSRVARSSSSAASTFAPPTPLFSAGYSAPKLSALAVGTRPLGSPARPCWSAAPSPAPPPWRGPQPAGHAADGAAPKAPPSSTRRPLERQLED